MEYDDVFELTALVGCEELGGLQNDEIGCGHCHVYDNALGVVPANARYANAVATPSLTTASQTIA